MEREHSKFGNEAFSYITGEKSASKTEFIADFPSTPLILLRSCNVHWEFPDQDLWDAQPKHAQPWFFCVLSMIFGVPQSTGSSEKKMPWMTGFTLMLNLHHVLQEAMGEVWKLVEAALLKSQSFSPNFRPGTGRTAVAAEQEFLPAAELKQPLPFPLLCCNGTGTLSKLHWGEWQAGEIQSHNY